MSQSPKDVTARAEKLAAQANLVVDLADAYTAEVCKFLDMRLSSQGLGEIRMPDLDRVVGHRLKTLEDFLLHVAFGLGADRRCGEHIDGVDERNR